MFTIQKLRFFIKRPKVQYVIRFLVHFLKEAPLHGLHHLARRDIHVLEFLFWILSIVVSAIVAIECCIYVSNENINWNSVLIVEKDYSHLEAALPAFTFCPHNIFDQRKAQQFLEMKSVPKNERAKILEFLEELSRRTIFSKNIFSEYNLPSWINPEVYTELILNFSIEHKIVAEIDEQVVPIFSELGLCYTINNSASESLSADKWIGKKRDNPFPFKTQLSKVSYRDSYPMKFGFTLKNTLNIFDFYIHSTYEIPSIWTRKTAVINTSLFEHFIMAFTVMEIGHANHHQEPKLSNSDIQTLKCRPQYDSNLQMFPKLYSKNFCLMECRARYAFKLCGCVPHFYALKSMSQRISTAPICTTLGLNCLISHVQIFKELSRNSKLPFRCRCPPPCQSLVVQSKVQRIETAEESNIIDIYLLQSPALCLHRYPIISGVDLAVSIGNFLSVFLGFSILGGVEMIYFCTLRLFWYRRGYLGEEQ